MQTGDPERLFCTAEGRGVCLTQWEVSVDPSQVSVT